MIDYNYDLMGIVPWTIEELMKKTLRMLVPMLMASTLILTVSCKDDPIPPAAGDTDPGGDSDTGETTEPVTLEIVGSDTYNLGFDSNQILNSPLLKYQILSVLISDT